jgi:hypothetical protein
MTAQLEAGALETGTQPLGIFSVCQKDICLLELLMECGLLALMNQNSGAKTSAKLSADMFL